MDELESNPKAERRARWKQGFLDCHKCRPNRGHNANPKEKYKKKSWKDKGLSHQFKRGVQ